MRLGIRGQIRSTRAAKIQPVRTQVLGLINLRAKSFTLDTTGMTQLTLSAGIQRAVLSIFWLMGWDITSRRHLRIARL